MWDDISQGWGNILTCDLPVDGGVGGYAKAHNMVCSTLLRAFFRGSQVTRISKQNLWLKNTLHFLLADPSPRLADPPPPVMDGWGARPLRWLSVLVCQTWCKVQPGDGVTVACPTLRFVSFFCHKRLQEPGDGIVTEGSHADALLQNRCRRRRRNSGAMWSPQGTSCVKWRTSSTVLLCILNREWLEFRLRWTAHNCGAHQQFRLLCGSFEVQQCDSWFWIVRLCFAEYCCHWCWICGWTGSW